MRRSIGIGLVLTAFQIWTACLLAPGKNFRESYLNLCTWDCRWYESIAREGYHSTVPPVAQNARVSNVAFFPAYPYAGRALYLGFGLDPHLGLLILSQFFCVLFWAALAMWLSRWRIPRGISALVILAVFAHPASLFLVLGYSESLFLSTLLLLILNARRARGVASLAGFVMSSTRILGLVAAGFPVLQLFGRRLFSLGASSEKGALIRATAVSVAAASGGLLFLLYCQLRFGRYNLYMETQQVGWRIQPDYGALLKWPSFRFSFPFDQMATLASGLGFVLLGVAEGMFTFFRQRSGLSRRLPVYAVAFFIFVISLSGLKNVDFLSMVRYSLPWFILLILCAAHLSLRLQRFSRSLRLLLLTLIASGLIYLFYRVQLPHFRDFLRGRWYA